jgi:hypothetical protein
MRKRRYRRTSYDYSYPARSTIMSQILHIFMPFIIIIVLALLGVIVILIIQNFDTFLIIIQYAFFIVLGLCALLLLYVVVRIISAISHRISAASVARSKAKLEQERVQQARVQVQRDRVQVRSQQAKLYRDDYTFTQKYEQPDLREGSRRTRAIHDDPYQEMPVQLSRTVESPRRTRKLHELADQEQVLSPEPGPEVGQETELEALGMPTKGQVFTYKSYKKYLNSGQLIVGVRKDGLPRIGSWQDFKITLILGSSSSGKSTTVLEKCVGHVQNNGLLVICDPGGFKPDSLTRRLGPLQHALMPGTSVALEHEDIMQNVERFRIELERRRRGADMTIPLLLVIDELNGLLMDKEIKRELTELIEKFAQQARGYNMYMILCAQRASGLAAIRNSVISFICHKCPEMEASKILPARYARLAPQLGTGQTFVSDANGEIEPLQQIFISPEDFDTGLGGTRFEAQPQKKPLAPRPYEVPNRRSAAAPKQQKLVLRRTDPDQTSALAQPSPLETRSSAGAIWGEETPENPPDQSQASAPNVGPTPAELAPKQTLINSLRQDTFEMLALRRAKKKK